MGNGTFDHGAQFFTVRSERFERPVAGWLEAGVVEEWTRGFADVEGRHNNDGYPRYSGTEGMNSVSKHLARGLDVRTGERALQVNGQVGAWETRTASGRREIGAALLLTAPVPQSLTLLRSACVELPDEVGYKLESISYAPCLALMALLDAGRPAFPSPSGCRSRANHRTGSGATSTRVSLRRPASPYTPARSEAASTSRSSKRRSPPPSSRSPGSG